MNNTSDKYQTYIDGLDSLFYGGLYIKNREKSDSSETDESRKSGGDSSSDCKSSADKEKDNLLLLARGVHGVNKVHLAMQICEGMYLSMNRSDEYNKLRSLFSKDKQLKKILFISLNKDTERLRDTYVGFYVQRLIRGFQRGYQSKPDDQSDVRKKRDEDFFKSEFEKLFKCEEKVGDQQLIKDIKEGVVYYDDRIHKFCCSGSSDIIHGISLNDSVYDNIVVKFIGRDKIHIETIGENSFDIYRNAVRKLKEEKREGANQGGEEDKEYECIMIDGLSCLSEEELKNCDFSILSSILRELCKIGVITADEKLQPPAIPVDIVIDMAIREEHNPDCVQYALKISKCLYQKHVYGWHSYKMRRIGIEVIPSLHFQMNSRFHMDDAVLESSYGMDKVPPMEWIREGGKKVEERNYDSLKTDIGSLYAISVNRLDDGRYLMPKIKSLCEENKKTNQHFLFVDFSRNRIEFYRNYNDYFDKLVESSGDRNRIHFFSFFPGYIHDDDFLYTIEKQVKSLYYNENLRDDNTNIEDYSNLHLVIGDINNINFGYPCLNRDKLLLPALSIFTKKHHMTNFIYTSASWEISILDREKELYQQLKVIAKMMY